MKKSLLLVLMLTLCICLLSGTALAAGDKVTAEIYTGKFTVNYRDINCRFEQYPILKYRDILYLPLTWDFTQNLQLNAAWSSETGLIVSQTDNSLPIAYRQAVLRDTSYVQAEIAPYPIELCGERINNIGQEWPFLVYQSIIYMPLTWDYLQLCGISSHWSAEEGLRLYSPLSWQYTNPIADTYDLLNEMCFTPLRYHCTGYDGEKQYDFYISTSIDFYDGRAVLRADIEGFDAVSSITLTYNTNTALPASVLYGQSVAYDTGYKVPDPYLLGSENINVGLLFDFLKTNTVAGKAENFTSAMSFGYLLELYNTTPYCLSFNAAGEYIKILSFGVERKDTEIIRLIYAGPEYRLEIMPVE